MNRFSVLIVFLVCIWFVWVCPGASAQSVPSLNEIGQAWKARQDRIRSARFEWTETRLIPRRSMPPAGSFGSPAPPSKEATKAERLPGEDLFLNSRKTLSVSGAMMRYTREGDYWDLQHGRVAPESYVAAFDGETAKMLFTHKEGHPDPSPFSGYVEKTAQHPDQNTVEFLPILLAARPCNVEMGGRDLRAYTVSPRVGTIDGHECVLLNQVPKPKVRWLETLWLDPRRGFIVARAVRSVKGHLDRTFDISYEEGPSGVWLPACWKCVSLGPLSGRIMGQVVVQITRREVNVDVPRSEFQIDFPVGAMVHDRRTGAAPPWYIVRAGGVKREITRDEMRREATYDQLVSTESGMAGLPAGGRRWMAVGAGLAVLTLIVCAALLRRRWTRGAGRATR